MRLFRPYIPLDVRCLVLCRQLGENKSLVAGAIAARRLGELLDVLKLKFAALINSPVEDLQLDHDPALENRGVVMIDGKVVDYSPPANDPDYLFYRPKDAHYIKTHVRGAYGAQYSDAMLAKRERNRNRERPKRRWPSRPFPKRRKS